MQAVKTSPVQPVSSRLGGAKKGRLTASYRVLIYGSEGTGKSTLAAASPSPIFFDIEDGSGRLDVTRYPFADGETGHVPATYADVIAAVDDLTANPHDFKTLVVDTLDRLEALIHRHVCRLHRKESIEDFGYGRGYQAALDEWRHFALRLDRLRTSRGMSIVLLAHAHIKTFKSPSTDDYDRYNLRLHEKASGFLREWSDVCGFACFEEGTAKVGDRVKGYSTGRRLLKLRRTAAYDAKSRLSLPDEIALDPMSPWAPLAKAVESSGDASALVALIEAELAKLTDAAVAAKVRTATETASRAGDVSALSRYLERVRELNNTPAKEEQ